MTYVAGFGPEVREIGRVGGGDPGVERGETMDAHRPPAEPGLRQETHAGGLTQRFAL